MTRKLGLSLVIAGLMLAAVPAIANAAAITSKAGSLAPVGTSISLNDEEFSTPFTISSSLLGKIECVTARMQGSITNNTGSSFEASGSGSYSTFGCFNLGNEVHFTSLKFTSIQALGSSHTGTMSFSASVDLAKLSCTFTGASVPFAYTGGGNAIVFSSAGGIFGSAGCGTATLSASFKMTIGGSSVILD